MKTNLLCKTLFVFWVCLPVLATEKQEQKSLVVTKVHRLAKQLLAGAPKSEEPIPIAVLDFASSEGKAKVRQLGKAVAMMMYDEITKDSRFKLIEREKLDKVVSEIALGQSGMVDEDQAKKAGDMLGAHLIIAGSVAEIGEYFLISCRVVDIGTAEIRANVATEIRQQNLVAVSSKYVVVKKYAIVPAFQSAIIPGWGQFYNDQPGKGIFFVLMAAASGGTFGFSYLFYQNVNYDQADTRDEAQNAFRKWKRYYQVNLASLGVYAAIWGISVLDAYLAARKNLKIGESRPEETAVLHLVPYLNVSASGTRAGLRLRL